MNDLMSRLRVGDFQSVLDACGRAGVPIRHCIDGGAGYGSTAKHMLRRCTGDVFAFEPFPGNHRFYDGIDPRIHLMPYALAEDEGTRSFFVVSTVQEDSPWGKKGLTGYSSTGRIVKEPKDGALTVRSVRADDAVGGPVDFIKLDLQGGELDALQGMKRLAAGCLFMFVEYGGQPGLLDYLRNDFEVYDTSYVFYKEKTPQALELFDCHREVQNSVGRMTWHGFRRQPWGEDYEGELKAARKQFGLTQTDLVCVNKRRASEFQRVIQELETRPH